MGLADIDKDLGTKIDEDLNAPRNPVQQLMDYVQGARHMQGSGEWFSGSGGSDRLAAQLTPSLGTTLGLTMPAKGMGVGATPGRATTGVLPSLGRVGAVGAASAGGAALEGEDPLQHGLVAGGIQGATEALPAVAGPAVRAAENFVPGAAARAIKAQTRALSNLKPQAPVPEGGPWGKFGPTGAPPGKVLGPNGQPAIPAVPPEFVPHPTRPGWGMMDEILPPATPAAPQGVNAFQSLMRLLGAGAQEGYERGGM